MKKITVLLFALTFRILALSQANSLQEGNICFTKGDYACAIEKYKEAIKLPDERQKKIAGDNLRQAEKCFELRRMADAAFNSKNFIKAKEHYQSLVNENSKDEYAMARLNEIKIALITLSVSKNTVLFSSSGGKEIIYITTEADSYVVGLLPSWCSVQKFEKYFSITCIENTLTTERTDNFTVSAGSKTERINIRQSGKQVITLSVSKEQISFTSSTGNSGPISVYTNAEKFSISKVPSWYSVQTFKSYFIVTCSSNNSTQPRSDWFNVIAGNNEVKIYVSQEGYKSSIVSTPVNPGVEKKIKEKYFFINSGVVANDLKNISNGFLTIGTKSIYLRIKFNYKGLENVTGGQNNSLKPQYECDNSVILNYPANSGAYYRFNGAIENKREAYTLGYLFGGGNFRFYLGAGYGKRSLLWGIDIHKNSTNEYVQNSWAKNINNSVNGVEGEAGIFLKFSAINILGGASIIYSTAENRSFIDAHAGLGITLGKKK